MDDYNVNVLSEAKNEYSSRLITILSPLILEGIKSIFNDAYKLCLENEEEEKYLMTFQNFLSRVPKWNTNLIEEETQRIIAKSKCNYLEDLLTCVHITQLKILTSIRVSQKQKKVEIEIPKLSDFIHKCYTLLARKLYTNVYLYEKDIMPLTFQKNMRECEILCRECIFETIRDGIPIESILRAYIDETVDEEIIEEEVEKIVDSNDNVILDNTKKNTEEESNVTKLENTVEIDTDEKNTTEIETEKTIENLTPIKMSIEDKLPIENDTTRENMDERILGTKESNVTNIDEPFEINIQTTEKDTGNDEIKTINTKPFDTTNKSFEKIDSSSDENVSNDSGRLSFNDNDSVLDMGTNEQSLINAPKDIPRLEQISTERNEQRKLEEEEYDDDDEDEYEKINIMGDTELTLDTLDVHNLDSKLSLKPDPILNDIEILS